MERREAPIPLQDVAEAADDAIWEKFADVHDQEPLLPELSDGGEVLMPLDDYGFSKRFAWVADRFGVSWQLNLT